MATYASVRTASDLDLMTPEEVSTFKVAAARKAAALGLQSAPLVAKGDSWFDFLPGTDVIDCLRDRHALRIANFSKAGDTLENMILGNSADEEGRPLPAGIEPAIAEVARSQPKYFLFSGGGNDVAGSEFINYLNHAKQSTTELLRISIVDEMIDRVFKSYLEHLLTRVSTACPETIVVMHGYGHALPTGKGTGFFGFTFAGPWLLPGLRMKAIDPDKGREVIRVLIDRYNLMLQTLSQSTAGKLLYVDLRDVIKPTDWRDELHLRNSAYARVADQVAKVLT